MNPFGGEMFQAQYHMGMILYQLLRIFLVILGNDGQQHTLTLHI